MTPEQVSLVQAAVAHARKVLHFVPVRQPLPRLAIEAAEAWCRGGTIDAALDAGRAARCLAAQFGHDCHGALGAAVASTYAAAYAAFATDPICCTLFARYAEAYAAKALRCYEEMQDE
jgi:hypothetical protein